MFHKSRVWGGSAWLSSPSHSGFDSGSYWSCSFDTIIYKFSDIVHYSLANHNTPAQTNQSEPIACFWGSGFIVNRSFKWQRRKRLTIKGEFMKN